MDLIGNIKHIEHGPGGRKPNHGKGKPAQKNTGNDAADEKNALADTHHSPPEHDPLLGRTVDTSA